MYNVGYIDDDDGMRNIFSDHYEKYFNVIDLDPPSNIQDIIDNIKENELDGLVLDHHFSKATSVNYDGAELLSCIHSRYALFPIVIVTGYETDALKNPETPHIVFTKSDVIHSFCEKFASRVVIHIETYKRNLQDSEDEYKSLLEKRESGSSLSPQEYKRLVDLDDYLEKSLLGENALPARHKSFELENDLNNLIDVVNNLCKGIE